MSWGDSFTSGLSAGSQLRDRYERRKMDKADSAVRKDVLEKQLAEDARMHAADESLRREKFVADQVRYDAAQAALASDPGEQLRRARAEKELAGLNAPPAAPTEEEVLAGNVRRLKLQKEMDSLNAPPLPAPTPPPPTARVTQAFGDGGKSKATFDVPMSDLQKTMRPAYRSPYESQIADLGNTIADNQAEIEGGDTRTGFLGIGTSRQDVISKAKRQRLQLQAMELQDQLQKGYITQDEADQRANQYLSLP